MTIQDDIKEAAITLANDPMSTNVAMRLIALLKRGEVIIGTFSNGINNNQQLLDNAIEKWKQSGVDLNIHTCKVHHGVSDQSILLYNDEYYYVTSYAALKRRKYFPISVLNRLSTIDLNHLTPIANQFEILTKLNLVNTTQIPLHHESYSSRQIIDYVVDLGMKGNKPIYLGVIGKLRLKSIRPIELGKMTHNLILDHDVILSKEAGEPIYFPIMFGHSSGIKTIRELYNYVVDLSERIKGRPLCFGVIHGASIDTNLLFFLFPGIKNITIQKETGRDSVVNILITPQEV